MPAPDPDLPHEDMSIPELIRLRDDARFGPVKSEARLRTIEAVLAARLNKLPPFRYVAPPPSSARGNITDSDSGGTVRDPIASVQTMNSRGRSSSPFA